MLTTRKDWFLNKTSMRIVVKSSAYQLKGKKGSISFKWKTNAQFSLDPENEKEFAEKLAKVISEELQKIAL